jgi:SET domain-containing protein
MYKQYLKVKTSKNKSGVFTSVRIPKGVPVIEVTGDVHPEHQLPDPNHPALLQVGPNIFIGPSGDVDDYINHSCDPNCKLQIAGSRAILFSLYDIPAGGEITFDYSTSSTDTLDTWKIECKCGSNKCRKVISGLQYVDPAVIEDYKKRGILPMFMTVSIFQKT